MPRFTMQKANIKVKRGKKKKQNDVNPFNDLSFWLQIATTDFSFCAWRRTDTNFKKEQDAKRETIC